MGSNSEIRYMNFLKALGIIAVVLGHCKAPMTSFIYMYHMALFFFVSGYFYKDHYEQNPVKFIFKKIKSLYVPYFICELVYVIFRNFFISINLYDPKTLESISSMSVFIKYFKIMLTFNYTQDNLLGAFWFLKALFYVNISFLILSLVLKKIKIKSEYQRLAIVIGIYLIGFYALNHWVNMGYNDQSTRKILGLFTYILDYRNFMLLLIFYSGYLYKKLENKIPLNIYLVIASALILYYDSLYVGGMDLANYIVSNPIYLIINSLLGIYINIYIAKKLASKDIKILSYIGKNSLYIMIFHFTAFKLVSLVMVKYYSLPKTMLSSYPIILIKGNWWIPYTIIGVFLPILMKYFVDILRRFFVNKNYSKIIIKNS